MPKPDKQDEGRKWISALWNDRKHELDILSEEMGKANLDKALRFCYQVSTLGKKHPPAGPNPWPKVRRILLAADDVREGGNEELADRISGGMIYGL
ncbi:MAG: hypothetical protein ACM3OG_09465 [Actinomycetota bacterium]